MINDATNGRTDTLLSNRHTNKDKYTLYHQIAMSVESKVGLQIGCWKSNQSVMIILRSVLKSNDII